MEVKPIQFRYGMTTGFKEKLLYILQDKMSLVVFLSVLIQSVLFSSILKSKGTAGFSFDIKELIYANVYMCLLFSVILVSIPFLFSGKARLRALVLVNLLFSVLLVGDLWYYRGFDAFLSLYVLPEAQNLNGISENVMFATARPVDLVFFLDNLVVMVLAFYFRKQYAAQEKKKGVFALLFFVPVLIFVLVFAGTSYAYRDDNGIEAQGEPHETMNMLSPVGYHVYDSILYAKDQMQQELDDDERREIRQWLDEKNERLPDNEYRSLFKGKNIVFIQVESLENFVIHQQYNGQSITPNLNRLTGEGLYFSNIYDQVNNGNSADSDLMANASVYPIRRGSTFYRYPDNRYNALGELLKEQNYTAVSAHASDGAIWNISTALKNFGFDKSYDVHSFPDADMFSMGLTDKSFFEQVLKLLQQEKEPAYYYTVTVTSHVPFETREDMRGLELEEEFAETSMGNYLQTIHYADEQIGNFITELDGKGLLENTVVVIYGDHCGVHKYYEDEANALPQYQSWWENEGRVPFIIYGKGLEGMEIKTAGGQIDIMPTVAYLAGVDPERYEDTTMGRNLLNTRLSYALLDNGTIIGEEGLTKEQIEHIRKSFTIADLVIESDYFNSDK